MPLAPSGSGRPVCSFHHTPRSTTSFRSLVAVGELAFVNDQPGVDRLAVVLAGDDGRNDLVERHVDVTRNPCPGTAAARGTRW